jgi:pyruvate/2-oxoacid:ferredoxin oxidoreductase beta subunit
METTELKLSAKDFVTDQEVRWCPGCGDYSILKQVQTVMPELGIPREEIVFHLRNWLLITFSVLYGNIWDAQYSWPCNGYCKWIKSYTSRI